MKHFFSVLFHFLSCLVFLSCLIFHASSFIIRNYSPEVINIQRREAELSIILPMVNNFNIKQKKAPIANKIWEDEG